MVRNTRRITFVLHKTINTMTLTATFRDCKTVATTGKRGATKWNTEWFDVVDTLHPVEVVFGDERKVYYTRGKDAAAYIKTLYNADGTYAKGVWRHGRYGTKMHEEVIKIQDGKLIARASYSSGQIKDQHKYLLAIK